MSATEIDPQKLEAVMGQAVLDMGAAISAPLFAIGDRLGLYWMIVEPFAGDHPEDKSGEERLTEVIKEGGFASVRRATETPFNLILEAKP